MEYEGRDVSWLFVHFAHATNEIWCPDNRPIWITEVGITDFLLGMECCKWFCTWMVNWWHTHRQLCGKKGMGHNS